jgi:methyltransferase (TIGR00027 family)
MSQNITVFQPDFNGSPEEALRLIVNSQLSPSPLGRALFAEQSLETAVALGAKQYLIFAAGYDTFVYRQPDWAAQLNIFELDHPATALDKQHRLAKFIQQSPANLHSLSVDFNLLGWTERLLECEAFNPNRISFGSLLGISYYLTPSSFKTLLGDIANLVPAGSSLVFDYPDEHTLTDAAGPRAKRQVMMAAHAGEPFLASYSYTELEMLLQETGWLIYRHLLPDDITRELFHNYNHSQPAHPITAFDNVNYCLAVKR